MIIIIIINKNFRKATNHFQGLSRPWICTLWNQALSRTRGCPVISVINSQSVSSDVIVNCSVSVFNSTAQVQSARC